jgi:glycosyltransferase involved in cell wall biosynthesis
VLVVHAKTEADEAARRVGVPRLDSNDTPHPVPLSRDHLLPSRRGEGIDSDGSFPVPSPHGNGERARVRGDDPAQASGSRRPRIVRTFLPVHELGGAIPTRTEARKRLGLNGNVALFFGHVRPFKGLDVALRAWRLLHTDVTLVVAGEAWWKGEETYRQLAKGLDNVRFDFRYIPDAEIATYFAASDVVLAPYRIEAQSGVALTAFHFARPVIASDAGGLPEIIEPDMVFPSENHVTLAARIDAFFARRDRAMLEQRAADAARKYSWEEYGALFRRLGAGE